MAVIFDVVYPSGERAIAIGYPGTQLRVDVVPPGPDSCLYDEIEVDFSAEPCPVLRVLGGPRRPTYHVRVDGGEVARELWMTARESEGWNTLDGHDPDPDIIWIVAMRDDLDPAALERDGATRVR